MEDSAADLVRSLRVQAGSHDKLAKKLGTSRQRVIDWEKGATPSAAYAQKLSDLSGLPMERFRPPSRNGGHPASRLAAIADQVAGNTDAIRDLAQQMLDFAARLEALELQQETRRRARGDQ